VTVPLFAMLVAATGMPPVRAAAAEATTTVVRAPSVSVATVETATVTETALVTGTLVARNEVLVPPEIDGVSIVEILVEEGDRVVEGQVLARLSRETIDALLAQSAAQIERAAAAIIQARNQITEAQANRAQADAAFARTRTLQDRGNASTELLEQREAAARVAAARVASNEQALRLAEADKVLAEAQRRELTVRERRTEIRAPAAGVVSRRTARIGALAAMNGDPLFRIIRDGVVELEADVPEVTLARLRVGQAATVRPAGMNEDIAARIRLIAPEVSRTTRQGRVRIAIEGGRDVPIGAFARATVVTDRRDGPTVPLSAVLYRAGSGPGAALVQVVKDAMVETRSVTVGLKADGRAEIREGLAPGETVVALAGTFVRNGDRVTPVPVAADAASR
jgi:HlyD family secretion protein